MFHLIYDPKDNTCLIANVDFQHTIVAIYKEISSNKIWNSFKDTASKAFVPSYNTTKKYIASTFERNDFILLTTQASLEEVQSFIKASPELLI